MMRKDLGYIRQQKDISEEKRMNQEVSHRIKKEVHDKTD